MNYLQTMLTQLPARIAVESRFTTGQAPQRLDSSKTWKSRNLRSKKRNKFSKLKSILPKMLARSGLVGKILQASFGAIPSHCFHGPKKCKNILNKCLFFFVGQWAPFTWFGPVRSHIACLCFGLGFSSSAVSLRHTNWTTDDK